MELQNDERALLRVLEESRPGPDLRTVADFLWRLRWWILLCLCVTVSAGWLYLGTRTTVHIVTSRAAFADYHRTMVNLPMARTPEGTSQASYVKDEMIMLQSPSLMTAVVESLGINVRYFRTPGTEGGQTGESEFYGDSPFSVSMDFDPACTAKGRPSPVEVEFTACDAGRCSITGIRVGSAYEIQPYGNVVSYGDTLSFGCGTFSIVPAPGMQPVPGANYRASYVDPADMARGLLSGFSVAFERFGNQSTNVVIFSLHDSNVRRAADVLNRMVPEYNREFREQLCRSYEDAIGFIDARLAGLGAGEGDRSCEEDSMVQELRRMRIELELTRSSVSDRMMVVEPAGMRSSTTGMGAGKVYLLALLAGLLLPVAVVLLRGALRMKVETADDLTGKLGRPVAGILPKVKNQGSALSPAAAGPLDESFRMLRTSLMHMGGRVLQVTSSADGEGKTFTAVNLALSFARLPVRVALLGLDLRTPLTENILPQAGKKTHEQDIVSFLAGGCGDPALIPVSVGGPMGGRLDVFFTGHAPVNAAELLSTERLRSLMDWCRGRYDYVICDTPAAMSVADPFIVSPLADAVLYVVRCDRTRLDLLPRVKDLMDSGRLGEVRPVLDGCDTGAWKYRYGLRPAAGFCMMNR